MSLNTGLSRQEERVLFLARQGYADKQIAAELGLSADTVRTYWQRIRKKVGGQTRAEIVATLSDQQTEAALHKFESEKNVLVEEILRRKSMEKALRTSEQQWRLMAEAMPQIVFVADPDARARFFNKRFFDYTGLDMVDALGGGWIKVIHRQDVVALARELKGRSIQAGSAEIEIRIRRNDGSYRWHMCRSIPVRNDSGEITQWIGTATDVHDQMLLRQTLQNRMRNLEQAQTIAKLGFYEYNLESDTSRWSDNLFDLFELPRIQGWFESTHLLDLVHPEDADRVSESFAQTLDQRAPFDQIYRVELRSGRLIWVHSVAQIIEGEEGRLTLLGTIQDVTERQEAEAELRVKQEILTIAEATANLGSFRWLPGARHSVWTDNLYRLVGRDPAHGIPTQEEIVEITHPDFREAFAEGMRRSADTGQPFDMEYKILAGDKTKWVRTIIALQKEDGELQSVLGTSQDITESVLKREELSRKNEQMEYSEKISEMGSFYADYETDTMEWSPNMFALVGREPSEGPMWGAQVSELMIDGRERYLAALEGLRTGTQDMDEIVQMQALDGREICAHIRAFRIFRGSKFVGAQGYLRDISEARQSENRIRISEQRWRTICDTSPVGIYLTDAEGKCLFVNQKGLELSGCSLEDALGLGWTSIIHPDDLEMVYEEWNQAVSEHKPFDMDYRFRHADGTVVPVHIRATNVQIDNDEQGYVGIIEDLRVVRGVSISEVLGETETLTP
jgi:PAS domain S-box-containing protein